MMMKGTLLLFLFPASLMAWTINGGNKATVRPNCSTASHRRLFSSVGENFSTTQVMPKQMKKKNLRTFPRYLEVECWKRQEIRDLERVLLAVSDACRQISRIVSRAKTDDVYGVATNPDGTPLDENVQGEVQQKLDVLCNTIMLRALCGCSSSIAAVASEEEDLPRSCCEVMGDSAFSVGDYVAVFDPIDGSKNIDSSLPVGTIFGIFRTQPGASSSIDAFKQNGNSMVAAGYCLYS